MMERLYNLLRDPSVQVVIGAINVLDEIMQEEGGMAVN